jgi:hypothetical protein
MTKGYCLAVMVVIDSILKNIPKTETVKLVFEAQERYEIRARMLFDANKKAVTSSGVQKLSGIEFIPKDSSVLTQPADFLAFAMLQGYRDQGSKKFQWCKPILNNSRPAFGMLPDAQSRAKWRTVIQATLSQHPGFMEAINAKT